MLSGTSVRWVSWAAVIGGALWMVYGICFMLQPWGAAEVYQERLGYEVVVNMPLYWIYNLPGGLAILLTALALRGIYIRHGRLTNWFIKLGIVLTYIALGLAVLSLVGTVVLFAPLSFAGRAFGACTLGVTALFVAWNLRNVPQVLRMLLLMLGLGGLFLLPLLPLVFAVQLISAGIAAGLIALFGLGWIAVGYLLRI